MKSHLSTFNTLAFIVSYLLIFGLILYKVFNVPITHDEVGTILFYNNFSFWDIIMLPGSSPNNHILNTVLVKVLTSFFGNSLFIVRLPNVLAFVVFSIAVFRLVKNIFTLESIFFVAASTLFIANPYLLDFFSLCRGYGLSIAFLTLSLSYLFDGFKTLNNKQVWKALMFAIVACYASFTLLVFWVAISLIVIMYFALKYKGKLKQQFKKISLLILLNTLFLILIAVPIYKMNVANEFVHWTSNGFKEDTIKLLVMLSLYGSEKINMFDAIVTGIIAVIIADAIYLSYKIVQTKFNKVIFFTPLFVAVSLILLTVIVNLVQVWFLETPNLVGRTALFFYPLFIVVFISTIDLIIKNKSKLRALILSLGIILFSVYHLLSTVMPSKVKEWWYDAYTVEVINFIKNQSDGNEVIIETSWLFNPSFQYHVQKEGEGWLSLEPYSKELDLKTDALYYYIQKEDYTKLKNQFYISKKYGDNFLLKRKRKNIEVIKN